MAWQGSPEQSGLFLYLPFMGWMAVVRCSMAGLETSRPFYFKIFGFSLGFNLGLCYICQINNENMNKAETLSRLRKSLRYGDIKKIANQVGCSEETVRVALKGDSFTTTADLVIDKATAIVGDHHKADMERLEKAARVTKKARFKP
jgi:NACalpha-BTF3-like transcription factor